MSSMRVMLCAWDVEDRRKRKRAERARVVVMADGFCMVECRGDEWKEVGVWLYAMRDE